MSVLLKSSGVNGNAILIVSRVSSILLGIGVKEKTVERYKEKCFQSDFEGLVAESERILNKYDLSWYHDE